MFTTHPHKLDYSQITDDIFIGATPAASDYEVLKSLGVSLIINMRFDKKLANDDSSKPLDIVWIRTADNRFFPITLAQFDTGVQAAKQAIDHGGKIFVSCKKGRHRSVAMAAAILISQGYSYEAALQTIKDKRPVADPDKPHIRKAIRKYSN